MDRINATEQIEELDVPTFLTLLAYDRQYRKREKTTDVVLSFGAFLLFLIIGLWTGDGQLFWPGFGDDAKVSDVQRLGAIALARAEDVTDIGKMVAALQEEEEVVQDAVWAALTHLLPLLQASDSHLLGEPERRTLLLFLDNRLFGRRSSSREVTDEETHLILASLKALAQVGDASFIPVVRSWTVGNGRGSDPRIRNAAVECLPYLEQSSIRRQEDQQLVRASGRDASVDREALLRPAADTQSARTDGLLRHSAPED